ncbi:putative DNA-directed RNA polymerase [Lupinus albus]|uniref:Putative DNA-directed RNA polymerase n=1 Tax=Lupinus albus TaxID=3870 RepID=A0A6A4PHG9_LUPAL|nr:putative DNA-directed RNA polymerase [Lupinus albus]
MMQLELIDKNINFDSPLWLRLRLDQRVISSREAPIEVHYESLGTYHNIYEHYLVVRSIKKIHCIYIFEPLLVIFLFIEKTKNLYKDFPEPIHRVSNH